MNGLGNFLASAMPAWLYDGRVGVFILLDLIIGAGAAYMSGRALALKWRALWQVFIYMFLLAWGVRFLHFALYGEVFLSLKNLLVDYLVMLFFALLGYRLTRVKQMVTQYYWLYERAGPFAWRKKQA